MRWKRALVVTSLVLVAYPASAEIYGRLSSGMAFRFNESEQKHPQVATLAIPVMGPVTGYDGGQRSFEAMYRTSFRLADDPRNSTGKVILQVEVIRNNHVIWRAKKRSKVKYDRYTSNECGNCTHKLRFRNRFHGSLQHGDLVLFRFKFKGMPRFEAGEAGLLGANIE